MKSLLDNEDLEAFIAFGETNVITEEILLAMSDLISSLEDRVDTIWKYSDVGHSRETTGFTLGWNGINAEDTSYNEHLTISYKNFADDGYIDRLKAERKAKEEKAKIEKALMAQRKKKKDAAEKERREYLEYRRLHALYGDVTQ